MADPSDGGPPPETRLKDLRPGVGRVEVVGRLVAARYREVTRRSDRTRRRLLAGWLADGTSTVRFTWWDPPAEGVDTGTVIRAVGAEVSEFRHRTELTFSWRTRVGPAGDAELPYVDVSELPRRTVRDLAPREEGFVIDVRVARLVSRTVSVGEERRLLFEGIAGDGTGTVALTAWSDFGLKDGETVRLVGAYVSAFRGRRRLVLDERSTVMRIGETNLPEAATLLSPLPRPVAAIEEEGGGESVAVEGTVLGVIPPSGVVHRCDRCRRQLRKGHCPVHGASDGVPDLRARLVLDDGTGSLTVATGRDDTERLWGVTLREAEARLRDRPDPELLSDELGDAVLGARLRVRGRATLDEFGLTLVPEAVERISVDLEAAADELEMRVEKEP